MEELLYLPALRNNRLGEQTKRTYKSKYTIISSGGEKAVLPWFVRNVFIWSKLLCPAVMPHGGEECCPLVGADAGGSTFPRLCEGGPTGLPQVTSRKIPALRSYSRSQRWLWFSPSRSLSEAWHISVSALANSVVFPLVSYTYED